MGHTSYAYESFSRFYPERKDNFLNFIRDVPNTMNFMYLVVKLHLEGKNAGNGIKKTFVLFLMQKLAKVVKQEDTADFVVCDIVRLLYGIPDLREIVDSRNPYPIRKGTANINGTQKEIIWAEYYSPSLEGTVKFGYNTNLVFAEDSQPDKEIDQHHYGRYENRYAGSGPGPRGMPFPEDIRQPYRITFDVEGDRLTLELEKY